MSRIWGMMDTGKRSMMNSQTALQTTGHNIASKNVDGFTRQRVEVQTVEPTGQGKLRIGNGARASQVIRINNPFIEKQLEHEGNVLGNRDSKMQLMGRVEQVFNEQMNKGLNKYMGEFFNSYREMSNSPENLALRNLVRESGDFLAKDFQRVHRQLTKIQEEADYQITSEVSSINGMTKEISNLNEKIASVEINGITANDERDRRDKLVKDLGQKMDIKYAESNDGVLTISGANTAILVSGSEQRDLVVSPTGSRDNKRESNVDIYYKSTDSGAPVRITDRIKGGTLGGILEVRDSFINDTLGQVDDLAFNLANEVNSAHTSGYDRANRQGVNFFETGAKDGCAERISLNKLIQEDPGRVVAAAQQNSPGDNRVANVISELEYKTKFGENNSSTLNDHYGNIVGHVGVSTSRANSEFESQKDIVGQLKNIRESISGVSLDEETAKMIEFQKTFEASARLIKVADEMMNTVMSLKQM